MAPNPIALRRPPRRFCFLLLALLALPLLGGGCNILGAIGQLGPHPVVVPAYTGLKGESVAVVVWADNLTVMNYPDVQSRLANAIQGTFHEVQVGSKDSKEKDLAGTRFIPNEIGLNYLRRHPASTIEEVAAAMPATRVMYIEIHNFDIHTQLAEDFFHGQIDATVRILEVKRVPASNPAAAPARPTTGRAALAAANVKSGPALTVSSPPSASPARPLASLATPAPDGGRPSGPAAQPFSPVSVYAPHPQIKAGFEERSIKASFPRRNPVGTTASDFGEDVYVNTLREFSEELSLRFFTHPATND